MMDDDDDDDNDDNDDDDDDDDTWIQFQVAFFESRYARVSLIELKSIRFLPFLKK